MISPEYKIEIKLGSNVLTARIIRNYARELSSELEQKLPITSMFVRRGGFIEIPFSMKHTTGKYVQRLPRGSVAFSPSRRALIVALDDVSQRSILLGDLDEIIELGTDRGVASIRKK